MKELLKVFYLFFFVLFSLQLGISQSTINEQRPLDKYNLQFVEIDKNPRIVEIKKEMVILNQILKKKKPTHQEETTDVDTQKYAALKLELKALRVELLNKNK